MTYSKFFLLGASVGLLAIMLPADGSAQEDQPPGAIVEIIDDNAGGSPPSDIPVPADSGSMDANDMMREIEALRQQQPQSNAPPAPALPPSNILGDGQGLPPIDTTRDPEAFYQAAPVSEGLQSNLPQRMDPRERPAAKFIIVEKDYDRQDNKSILVAANRAMQLGRFDAALDLFTQLYNKNPRDPRVLMGRAITFQNKGQIQNAIKMYEELLDVDPNNIEAEVSMLGLVRERFPALALKRLSELYQRDPNNAGLSAQLGLTYAGINDMANAMRFLGIAASLEPNNAMYYYNLGIVSERARNIKGAIRYYEEALNIDAIYGASRSIPRDVVYDRLAVLRGRS